MLLDLQVPRFTWPGGPTEIAPRLTQIARKAESAGFSGFWVMDHFFQIEMVGAYDEPMFEAYTTLGYVAAKTETIPLGTLVTGVVYREPGLLAKAVTSLDVLSGGRAWLGIGAAWFEREALAFGFPFPPLAERFERLEETLQIIRQMWGGDNRPFHGKHYTLEEPLLVPRPISQPHPKILIGGMGEKKTLRLVARYADACNLFGGVPLDELEHKLNVLKDHCEREGRDFHSIEKTVIHTLHLGENAMSKSDILQCAENFARLGITRMIVNMPNVHEDGGLERFGESVIPKLRSI